MKLIIFSLLSFGIFCLQINNLQTQNTLQSQSTCTSSLIDPIYYNHTPLYYGYYSSPYYYYYYDNSYIVPATNVIVNQQPVALYRIANSNETLNRNETEIQNEIDSLKSEIWGQKKYNTSAIRRNGKVYDPKWLHAQMKLARVIELEDMQNVLNNRTNPYITNETNGNFTRGNRTRRRRRT